MCRSTLIVWSFTIKVAPHLSWLTTEGNQIIKQRKVVLYQVRISSGGGGGVTGGLLGTCTNSFGTRFHSN